MNQNGITPKQQAEFYGLLLLVAVVVGSIAGGYLLPALGLCRQPGFLGQVLGGSIVMVIIMFFHSLNLQKENAKLHIVVWTYEAAWILESESEPQAKHDESGGG